MLFDAIGTGAVTPTAVVAAIPAPVVVVPVTGVAAPPVVVSPAAAFSSAAVSAGVVVSVPPPLPLMLEAQVDVVIVFSSSVTAAVCASSLPWIVAAVFGRDGVRGHDRADKLVPVPSVADEPTCQKTLHACAPFMRETLVFDR